jgi:hypothetical protein
MPRKLIMAGTAIALVAFAAGSLAALEFHLRGYWQLGRSATLHLG